MLIGAAAGVDRDFTSIAAGGALPALVVLLVVSVPVAVLLARRHAERSAPEWFVGVASIALILAVTLFRGEVRVGFDLGRLAEWSSDGYSALSRDPLGSSQFVLNVALFVPAGLAWVWLTGRAAATWVALVGGSLLVECVQALTGVGANDLGDLVANSAGAFLGVGIGVVAAAVASARRREISARRRIEVVGGLALVALVVSIGWFVGASRRQAHVRSVVEERFGDVDWVSINESIDSDFDSVLGAVDGVRADGSATSDRVELRYPATFFSLPRCVFVVWTPQSMEIRNASSGECTRFIG